MHLELFWQSITQPVLLTLESFIWLASTLNQYLWPESVPRLDRYIVKPVDTGGCTLMLFMVWNHALLLPIELHGITVWVVEYNIYTHTRARARTHAHTHTRFDKGTNNDTSEPNLYFYTPYRRNPNSLFQ